jgi:hypothetical protein
LLSKKIGRFFIRLASDGHWLTHSSTKKSFDF